MRTLNEINSEIENIREELKDVHGREAEVYTRIVGYYRSVRNWNKGKRDEYDHRKMFSADNPKTAELVTKHFPASAVNKTVGNVDKIELFTRTTCPNCPPVIDYCNTLDVNIVKYNVDDAEGYAKASEKGVRSAPTAILYNNGIEVGRAYSVNDLKLSFETKNEPIAVNA